MNNQSARFAPLAVAAAALAALAAPALAGPQLHLAAPPATPAPTLAGQLQVYTTSWHGEQSLVDQNHCPAGAGGQRRQIVQWTFPKPFLEAPQVQVAITGLDAGDGRNIRAVAGVSNPTRDGVTITFDTWCNTNIYQINGSAIAVGRQAP